MKVFLSSTALDLAAHRQAVLQTLRSMDDCRTENMENFGARPGRPVAECLAKVAVSDVLVAIVAHRYGWVPCHEEGGDGEKSITWLEVGQAEESGVPVLAFVVDPNAPWQHPKEQDALVEDGADAIDVKRRVESLKTFKARVSGRVRAHFDTPERLAEGVAVALGNWRYQKGTAVSPPPCLPDPSPGIGAREWQPIDDPPLENKLLSAWSVGDCTDLAPLDDLPCIVFAGVPGSGKTEAFRREFARLHGKPNTVCAGVDLRTYGSEQRLVEEVFRSPWWRAWSAGRISLTVYFDSLDECRVGTLVVTNLLSMELELNRPQLRNLRLRIACRTGDVPQRVRVGWRDDLFGKADFAELRLLPLSTVAVEDYLRREGILDRRELVAADLSRHPIALKLLARIGKDSSPARDGRAWRLTEIYDRGCRELAGETDGNRTAPLHRDEFFALDTRIAAVLMFSNRRSVCLGGRPATDDDVPLAVLRGGEESVGGVVVEATRDNLVAAMKMALFEPAPDRERVEFAHKTYAEFLASQYPNRRAVRSLLLHGLRVVPQLSEVAAWFACSDCEFREHLLKHDPQILLRSDVVGLDDDLKLQVARALLDLVVRRELVRNQVRHMQQLDVLATPRLADLLAPHLTPPYDEAGCEFAMTLVEQCRLFQCTELLYAIVLDVATGLRLRTLALHVIGVLGTGDARLLQLAEGTQEDVEDELKGLALLALWPGVLDTDRVFRLLSDEKRRSLYGSYAAFMHQFGKQFGEGHLPDALEWAASRRGRFDDISHADSLARVAVQRAWDHSEMDGVASGLARLALVMAEDHESILSRDTSTPSEEARRSVLLEVLRQAPAKLPGTVAWDPHPLLKPSDLDWLFTIGAELQDGHRTAWADAVRAAMMQSVRFWEEISNRLTMISEDPDLAMIFKEYLEPVDLEGERAQKARADQAAWQDMEERRRQAEQKRQDRYPEPGPKQRVAHWLVRADEKPELWWLLWRELTLTPTSTHYGDPLVTDVTKMPGWLDADAETRERLLDAAAAYLLVSDPKERSWIAKDKVSFAASAGYAALALLMREAPDRYARLTPPVWHRWAATVVAVPVQGSGEAELHQQMVAEAFQRAPDVVLATARKLLGRDLRKHGHPFLMRVLEKCRDRRVADMLRAVLRTSGAPTFAAGVLGELIRREDDQAIRWAIRRASSAKTAPDLRVALASQLLASAVDRAWPAMKPQLDKESEFGRRVLLGLARQVGLQSNWPSEVRPDRDMSLYMLLTLHFPYSDDDRFDSVHAVTDREHVQHLRDGLLRRVAALATTDAVAALDRAAESLPHLSWLRDTATETREEALRRTWSPPTAEEVMAILLAPMPGGER